MDQQKIGSFLKELRKGKDLTQEEVAEKLNVSGRTVSRWETGSNMPDLGILVELADFYDVDIREILNGERNNGKMNEELKDTLEQVAEYSKEEKERLRRKMSDMSCGAAILLLFSTVLQATDGFGSMSQRSIDNMTGFSTGMAIAILVINVLFLSGTLAKIKKWFKSRFKK